MELTARCVCVSVCVYAKITISVSGLNVEKSITLSVSINLSVVFTATMGETLMERVSFSGIYESMTPCSGRRC